MKKQEISEGFTFWQAVLGAIAAVFMFVGIFNTVSFIHDAVGDAINDNIDRRIRLAKAYEVSCITGGWTIIRNAEE